MRGGRQQFVHSKLMSWVAFDRALRMARDSALPCDTMRWESTRDEIYENIMLHGYSKERAAFVQHYGSSSLDASNLLMPLVGFISSRDPRMLSTLSETQRELVSDSLVYRYDPELAAADGLDGQEGTFSMCSFWYVECLARAGRLDEARLTLEKMFTYANHLGLYAEQIGPSGEALGNFPQAFTHLALISAASNLDRQLDERTAAMRLVAARTEPGMDVAEAGQGRRASQRGSGHLPRCSCQKLHQLTRSRPLPRPPTRATPMKSRWLGVSSRSCVQTMTVLCLAST